MHTNKVEMENVMYDSLGEFDVNNILSEENKQAIKYFTEVEDRYIQILKIEAQNSATEADRLLKEKELELRKAQLESENRLREKELEIKQEELKIKKEQLETENKKLKVQKKEMIFGAVAEGFKILTPIGIFVGTFLANKYFFKQTKIVEENQIITGTQEKKLKAL